MEEKGEAAQQQDACPVVYPPIPKGINCGQVGEGERKGGGGG